MANDADHLIEQVVADAEYDALREVANRLTGVLGQRQRTATDPDERDRYRSERTEIRTRLGDIEPGSDAAGIALAEWGARLRELDE